MIIGLLTVKADLLIGVEETDRKRIFFVVQIGSLFLHSELQIGIALLCTFQCSLQHLSLDHIVKPDTQSYRIIHNSNTAICMQAVAGCNLFYSVFVHTDTFQLKNELANLWLCHGFLCRLFCDKSPA